MNYTIKISDKMQENTFNNFSKKIPQYLRISIFINHPINYFCIFEKILHSQ